MMVLIHAASGDGNGAGRRLTNRCGCRASAASRVFRRRLVDDFSEAFVATPDVPVDNREILEFAGGIDLLDLPAAAVNPYGDGRASARIAAILAGQPVTPF